jgi:hypothetical protein
MAVEKIDLVQHGQSIWKFLARQLADKLNQLIGRQNRLWEVKLPTAGGTGKVLESEINVVLDLTQAKFGTSSGSPVPNDFSLSDATTGNETSGYTLQVGVKNGDVCDSVGGTTFLPNGMTQGGQPPFVISVSGGGDIYLTIAVSTGGTVTGVTINQGATPTSTSAATYLKLGDFAVNSAGNGVNIGSGAQGIGSQSFLSCAGIGYPWSL